MYMLTCLVILSHPSILTDRAPSGRPPEPNSTYFPAFLYPACPEQPPRAQRFQQVAAPATPDRLSGSREELSSSGHKPTSQRNLCALCVSALDFSSFDLFFISPLVTRYSPLSSVFPADPKNAPVNPVESALPKLLDLKPFRIRTYGKNRGVGVLLLTRNPRKDLCSFPMSANSRMDTITGCTADRGGHGIRGYSLKAVPLTSVKHCQHTPYINYIITVINLYIKTRILYYSVLIIQMGGNT